MRTAQPIPGSTIDLLAGAGSVLVNRILLRLRLRRRVDGWRRAAGLVLRGEESTFVLAGFGLDAWSDAAGAVDQSPEVAREHVRARLAAFFGRAAGCHIRVAASDELHRAERAEGACYSLAFEPWVEGPGRFLPPLVWRGEGEGAAGVGPGIEPLFNLVCRVGAGGVCDAWLRFNHVGIDGVPAQELVSALEMAWGVRGPVEFPTPEEFGPLATPRPVPGRAGIAESFMFVEFGELLAWRKAQNARLAEPMTLSAALTWRLGQPPAFAGQVVGSTVEVAASDGIGSGVGIVALQPGEFARRADGLGRFVREFNRQIVLNRRRRSLGCKTLDAMAFVPARRAEALLRHALDRQPRAFGAVGLTVLKDARVFGAPIGAVGHDLGFIAIGGVGLPAAGGRRVGCVGMKARAERIGETAERVRAAIAGAAPG